MSLTGVPLLILAIVAAIGSPVLALLTWGRVRGLPVLQALQRLSLVLLCQISAVLMTAIMVNNQFSLYDSWSDLFGQNAAVGTPVPDADPAAPSGPAAPNGPPGTDGGRQGAPPLMPGIGPLPGGRRISEVVTGPRSRIKATVWVVLPAGYNDPVNKDRRYPVIEFLPGYPGSPTTWLKALRLQETADAEIAAGRVQPFIAVLPTMNVAMPRDTECTDVPQGPQVATWLASDVPRIIAQQARTLPFGRNWGMTGYSTGGFCTAKLVLKFPEIFGSGAIMSGYYSTGVDATTGSIFGGSRAVMNANDPVWLVTHRTPPPVNLLAVYSLRDPGTLGPTQRFLAAVRPPLKVDVIRLTTGGHNTQVWLSVEPQVLDWLSGHIS